MTTVTSNPILTDALAYYASRRTMNNPKGWAHVERVLNRTITGGFYVHVGADQVQQARDVLSILAAAENALPDRDEPDFPADSSFFEIWEFHGKTPIRTINLGVSGHGYNTEEAAQSLADNLATNPHWTDGKKDPSFRVVTVTTTRTLVPVRSTS